MANRRMISKTIKESKKVLRLYNNSGDKSFIEFSLLLYTWLIPFTDDYGRMDGEADVVKNKVMPFSDRPVTDFDSALIALHQSNLIKLYIVENERFIEIVQFEKFQTFKNDRNRISEFPKPEEGIQWNPPESIVSDMSAEVKLREGKLREGITSFTNVKEEDFILPSKEETQNYSEPKLNESIERVCQNLYEKKIFPEVFAFKNKMANGKQSKRALLHTLGRCYLTKPKEPWPFCLQVMKVENGNFNEQEYRKDH